MKRYFGPALAVSLMLAGACSTHRAVTLDDVSENPVQYIGKNVTLHGHIEDVVGSRAFILENGGIIKNQVLVIASQPLAPLQGSVFDLDDLRDKLDDQDVSVTGPVEVFSLHRAEQYLGVDLNDDEFREYEGKLMILARDVNLRR